MFRAFAALTLLFALAAPTRADELPSFTVAEVAAKLGQKNVYVYDVNSLTVYKNGHVPGARWAMYDRIDASVLPADKSATLSSSTARTNTEAPATPAPGALSSWATSTRTSCPPASRAGKKRVSPSRRPPRNYSAIATGASGVSVALRFSAKQGSVFASQIGRSLPNDTVESWPVGTPFDWR